MATEVLHRSEESVVGNGYNKKSVLKNILFSVGVLLAFASQAQVQIIDSIAAIVDDDVVMQSELDVRLAQALASAQASGAAINEQEIRGIILDRLIVESLQIQMAQRAGFYIDDAQLNETMNTIAAQNKTTLQGFIQMVEQSGESYAAVREQVRKDMILQQVQRGNVNHKVMITPDEVDNFLESPEGKALKEVFNHLDHMLVPVSSQATDSEMASLQDVADAIAAKAANASYDELASQYADKNVARSDLGWRNTEQMPEIFRADVATMKVGDVRIVRSPSGFHVIKLLERRGNEPQIVPQTKVSHILIKPTEVLDIDQAKEKIEGILKRARDGEDFANLAKEYSDDIGTAQNGGDLGWSNSGQFVPEFEDTMHATDIGVISEPVRTQFGWHIIKVDGRRDEDVSDIVLRNRARGMIHERKYGEELEIWLQKIRDEAYVDIKI